MRKCLLAKSTLFALFIFNLVGPYSDVLAQSMSLATNECRIFQRSPYTRTSTGRDAAGQLVVTKRFYDQFGVQRCKIEEMDFVNVIINAQKQSRPTQIWESEYDEKGKNKTFTKNYFDKRDTTKFKKQIMNIRSKDSFLIAQRYELYFEPTKYTYILKRLNSCGLAYYTWTAVYDTISRRTTTSAISATSPNSSCVPLS